MQTKFTSPDGKAFQTLATLSLKMCTELSGSR